MFLGRLFNTILLLTGSLLYDAVNDRPNVALSGRVRAPKDMDWKTVSRVVKYLKGTKKLQPKLDPAD